MRFDKPLEEARLLRRYKRFLADVERADGGVLTVHCPNSGAMMGLQDAGNRVWISDSGNPKRKLRHTLELVEAQAPSGPVLVGMNTMMPNRLAAEAIEAGRVPALRDCRLDRREVPYGVNSRIDLLLRDEAERPVWVEVKNVHLVRHVGLHEFPDCRTQRGAKHLDELAGLARAGQRAVMLYIVQRGDGDRLAFAEDLDPHYAAAFARARAAGVEAFALRCHISPQGIEARDPIPVLDPILSVAAATDLAAGA